MSGKNDFGASHWSSDKVWKRRKKSKVIQVNGDPKLWMQQVTIQADLFTLLAIHGNLCLALRHPQNKGDARPFIIKFVKELGKFLVEKGALTPEQLKEAEKLEIEEGSRDLGTG